MSEKLRDASERLRRAIGTQAYNALLEFLNEYQIASGAAAQDSLVETLRKQSAEVPR